MILKLMNNNKMKKVKNVCTWTNIYGLDVRKSMLAFWQILLKVILFYIKKLKTLYLHI